MKSWGGTNEPITSTRSPSGVRSRTIDGAAPFLTAMGDVAALCRGTRSLARAVEVATKIAGVIPLRALGVGSLARCEGRWAVAPELLDRVDGYVNAAAAYFRGGTPRRELEAELLLASSADVVWTTLPLVADDGRVRGVLAVATARALDEAAIAFLAFVARELALVAARRTPTVASAIDRSSRPARERESNAKALLGDAA